MQKDMGATGVTPDPAKPLPTPEALEEQRLIRRMQMMMNMVMQVIAQDSTLTIDDASQMIADARSAALTFQMIYQQPVRYEYQLIEPPTLLISEQRITWCRSANTPPRSKRPGWATF